VAGSITIRIGGVPCTAVRNGNDTASIWQVNSRTLVPFLWCQTPNLPVGPHNLTVR
jgi:hypothetical protein